MLALYLDASTQATEADDNHKAICVAGCLASVGAWKDFERKIQELLDRNRVKVFHMTDCEAYQGEYLGWSKNRHDGFMREVVSTIKSRVSFSAASAVALKTYAQSQEKNPQLHGFSAFTFCALQCLQAIAARQAGLDDKDKIHYLFESGDRKGHELHQLFRQIKAEPWRTERYRMDSRFNRNGWSFVDKDDRPALASCDFCAYEGAKEMVNYHLPEKRMRPPRRSALEFVLGNKLDFRRHTEDGLTNLEIVQPK